MVRVDVMLAPLLTNTGLVTCRLSRIFEKVQPYHELSVDDAKTLTLDDYRAMLNIGPYSHLGFGFHSLALYMFHS
jgi:hypothetical protein